MAVDLFGAVLVLLCRRAERGNVIDWAISHGYAAKAWQGQKGIPRGMDPYMCDPKSVEDCQDCAINV